MAKIIEEGCVSTCGHCRTKFSFTPNEVNHSTKHVPAGYSPEEEAYNKSIFSVGCPKCGRSVDVGDKLGRAAKDEMSRNARHNHY